MHQVAGGMVVLVVPLLFALLMTIAMTVMIPTANLT